MSAEKEEGEETMTLTADDARKLTDDSHLNTLEADKFVAEKSIKQAALAGRDFVFLPARGSALNDWLVSNGYHVELVDIGDGHGTLDLRICWSKT